MAEGEEGRNFLFLFLMLMKKRKEKNVIAGPVVVGEELPTA